MVTEVMRVKHQIGNAPPAGGRQVARTPALDVGALRPLTAPWGSPPVIMDREPRVHWTSGWVTTVRAGALCMALSMWLPIAHGATRFYYGDGNPATYDYYESLDEAEAAMRANRAPWGQDLELCGVSLGNNAASYQYCTPGKGAIPWLEGYKGVGQVTPIQNAHVGCPDRGVPLGWCCDSEGEVVSSWLTKYYSFYCIVRQEFTGQHAPIPVQWATNLYYVGSTYQFPYIVANHWNTAPSSSLYDRDFVITYRACDSSTTSTAQARPSSRTSRVSPTSGACDSATTTMMIREMGDVRGNRRQIAKLGQALNRDRHEYAV